MESSVCKIKCCINIVFLRADIIWIRYYDDVSWQWSGRDAGMRWWVTHCAHPLIHSPTHSLTHWPTHSHTDPHTHSPTHPLTRSLTHSLTHLPTHSLSHSPTLSHSRSSSPTMYAIAVFSKLWLHLCHHWPTLFSHDYQYNTTQTI